jgi:tRNA-dihydrouridine synthase B
MSEFWSQVNQIKKLIPPQEIGGVNFSSPLLLAPMAGVTDAPLRRLMYDLGCGGAITELISCHAINYKNERTLKMLTPMEGERNTGVQLFGTLEDLDHLLSSMDSVVDRGFNFIDLNMGCPVRKVVTKGGGSALLKEPDKLLPFLKRLKEHSPLPFSIKIRTGWDQNLVTVQEVVGVAQESGVAWVAIHGRTRSQFYNGSANWEHIESSAKCSTIPIIGNGDLNESEQIKNSLATTNCTALMMGRGPTKNPFLFLTPFMDNNPVFTAEDYLEVLKRLMEYHQEYDLPKRVQFIQVRKQAVWFSAGFRNSTAFRQEVFLQTEMDALWGECEKFFCHKL